jgi:elongation factor P
MLIATEVRVGNVVKIDGKHCKVVSQEIRGTGKFGKTVNLKLKVIEDGHILEKSFRVEEKIENVDVRHVTLQYLYKDGDHFVFMNNETYEQCSVPAKTVGKQELFLKENTEINVVFDEDKPLSIDFPKQVELKVRMTPPGAAGRDSTYKEAELENGLKILVPQFVKEGETVRINTEDFSYLERLTVKSMKSDAWHESSKEEKQKN